MTEKDITICGHGSGRPSFKNMHEYLEDRHTRYMSNEIDKGLVCVRRLKALDSAGRERWKAAYNTLIGRNFYSQDLRNYVFTPYAGKYYSDCSSSICACYQKAGYTNVSLLNTEGMYFSNLFEDVPVTIKKGYISDPEKLKVGDILLFRGNLSRTLYIGHVEAVYDVPGTSDDKDDTENVRIEDDDMTAYKFRTIEIVDGKGMQGGDVLLVQEILNARGYVGRDGKPLALDGDTGDDYEKSNTMFAIYTYITERNAEGANLGDPSGWGPLCWGDQNFLTA